MSTIVRFRWAPSKYQNSGSAPGEKAVQQPSPSLRHVPDSRSITPAVGQGRSAAAVRPSADTWKLSPETGCASHTTSATAGSSRRCRRTSGYDGGSVGLSSPPT